MARTTWWRVGLALLLAAALVSWLVGYGLPDWMLTNQSPVRNVLEALSWPASVLAFLWIAVPSVLKWTRRSDAEPTDSVVRDGLTEGSEGDPDRRGWSGHRPARFDRQRIDGHGGS